MSGRAPKSEFWFCTRTAQSIEKRVATLQAQHDAWSAGSALGVCPCARACHLLSFCSGAAEHIHSQKTGREQQYYRAIIRVNSLSTATANSCCTGRQREVHEADERERGTREKARRPTWASPERVRALAAAAHAARENGFSSNDDSSAPCGFGKRSALRELARRGPGETRGEEGRRHADQRAVGCSLCV